MTQTAQDTCDQNFDSDIRTAAGPVIVYFHDPDEEACEFTDLALARYLNQQEDAPCVLRLNIAENPQTANVYSIPEYPTLLLIRNNHILGYKSGKMNPKTLAAWVENGLSRNDEDGVPHAEFLANLRAKERKQDNAEQLSIKRARQRGMLSNAVKAGSALAFAFAFPAYGLAGYVIAAYAAYRGYEIHKTPGERPAPPSKLGDRLVNGALNAATWACGLGMIAFAFSVASPLAFAGALGAGTFMLVNSSIGLGRELPPSLMIGTLKKVAEQNAKRNPTKPLSEFDPPPGYQIEEDKPESVKQQSAAVDRKIISPTAQFNAPATTPSRPALPPGTGNVTHAPSPRRGPQ